MSRRRDDDEVIGAVAANWFAQREDGLSPAQLREFERWCREDPRHAAAMARLEWARSLLGRMPEVRAELQPVLEFPSGTRAAPGRSAGPLDRGSRFVVLLAAAAVVALAAAGGWQWRAGTRSVVQYATAEGGYERGVLPDGSVVELNASTMLEVRLSRAERRVRLTAGEAHFSVARNAARPFIVEAAGVAVRAVGTAFNVRLAPAGVEVLVTHGRVAVVAVDTNRQREDVRGRVGDARTGLGVALGGPAPTELGANERLLVRTPGTWSELDGLNPSRVEKVEVMAVRAALSWQERKLVFSDTPLREVVAQFNARNRLQVMIGDPGLAERPVGGTFAADNVEGFVRLLEDSGTIAVERRGETEIVLRSSQ